VTKLGGFDDPNFRFRSIFDHLFMNNNTKLLVNFGFTKSPGLSNLVYIFGHTSRQKV
jgi:hypothetical protein